MLLDPRTHSEFLYSFKPVDSGMYGGQARIDWHACDLAGRYWLIEVKKVADTAQTINVLREVTPGQQDGLNAVSDSEHGIALLAVGRGDILYIFDWRDIRWRLMQPPSRVGLRPELVPWDFALLAIRWSGPKHWASLDLVAELSVARRSRSATTRTKPDEPSLKPARSASTSKPEGSTPTPETTRRLERLSSGLPARISFFEKSQSGGPKSGRTPTR
jgi:hypothetical protein